MIFFIVDSSVPKVRISAVVRRWLWCLVALLPFDITAETKDLVSEDARYCRPVCSIADLSAVHCLCYKVALLLNLCVSHHDGPHFPHKTYMRSSPS